jgi:hypothetical protein
MYQNLAEAIFDTLSLYIVENGFHDKVKELTPKNLKGIQKECEKVLEKILDD